VAAASKASTSWTARTKIPGSKPARVAFLSVVLSYVGTGLAIRWSHVQGILPKYLNRFKVSEVNPELEQVRGPKP